MESTHNYFTLSFHQSLLIILLVKALEEKTVFIDSIEIVASTLLRTYTYIVQQIAFLSIS